MDTDLISSMAELPLGYDHKYVYSHFGYNLKATDMQTAVGCAQLEKFPSFVERRRHNFDRLRAALADIEDKVILPVPCDNSRPSWFGFLITVREGLDQKGNRRIYRKPRCPDKKPLCW